MPYVNPPLCSERQPGTDYDCVPCSAIMLVNAHQPGKAPSTNTEADRLRAASGYTYYGGTSVEGIARGVAKRYGYTPRIATSFNALWSMLKPGYGAFVIIRPSNLPADHVLRRYMGTFRGDHCIYVGRKGHRWRVWMLDPEGPPGTGYTGNWLSKGDLRKAFVGSAAALPLHKR